MGMARALDNKDVPPDAYAPAGRRFPAVSACAEAAGANLTPYSVRGNHSLISEVVYLDGLWAKQGEDEQRGGGAILSW
jgi:hypothetical protein